MKVSRRQLKKIIKESLLIEQSYDAYKHKEIKEAVKRALEILDIKSTTLETLMIRIARTESGSDPTGKTDQITHHTKNPFQLDPINVINIKENSNLSQWRAFIDGKKRSKACKPKSIN